MPRLESTFLALSDSTRRSIIERLQRGPACVGDLAAPFTMSLNAVSKHIKILEGAGLVRRTRDGRRHELSLDAAPLREVARWVKSYESFWRKQLDELEEVIQNRRMRKS